MVTLQCMVGANVGVAVGAAVGASVGYTVGIDDVGEPVGRAVGALVGARVGIRVGNAVGAYVGVPVGEAVGGGIPFVAKLGTVQPLTLVAGVLLQMESSKWLHPVPTPQPVASYCGPTDSSSVSVHRRARAPVALLTMIALHIVAACTCCVNSPGSGSDSIQLSNVKKVAAE